MKSGSGSNGSGYILGTICSPDGQPTGKPKEVCVVEVSTRAEICRVVVDQVGRFLLRSDAVAGSLSDWVELQVLCDRGLLLGQAQTSVPRSAVTDFRITLDKPATAPSRTVNAPQRTNPGPAMVAVGTLARINEALQGRGSARDERSLVPSWVNASIGELNTLAALGRRVLEGDRAAERAFVRLVGEPGRGLGGSSPQGPSGTWGMPMPMPFSGGMGLPGRRSFGQSDPGGRPCIVDAVGVFVATAAGFMLDRRRADRLGDLTQPGALTRQTAELIKDRAFALEGFRDEVLDSPAGGVGSFRSHPPSGFAGGRGPDEPLDWPPGGPLPSGGPVPGSGPGGGGLPGGGGGVPAPGGGGGFPCGFWVDCVDEIVDAASRYKPPALCPREETIGSISPSAVCRGASNVELEIRPAEGESFSATGVCTVWLSRSFNKRVLLETISASSNLVRVRLKEAKFSGCIGFRGAGTGVPGNMAFIGSCFRMAGLTRNPVLNLARSAFDSPIACVGSNGLDVVPPPRLVSLHASGPNGGASGTTQVSLAEEGCTQVTLSWHFDLGSESGWVDPAEYIRVKVIASDGTVVAQNMPPVTSVQVSSREDESYVVHAATVVNGSSCGQAEGTITVERYQQIHLTGPDSLQVGQSANIMVRSSCLAMAAGLTVALVSSRPDRLQVPPTALIPAGQDLLNVSVDAMGAGCDGVVVTATAPGHLNASFAIQVFDTPKLDVMTPQIVNACRVFELQLSGTCFKEGETVVRASKAGEVTRTLSILSISDNVIQCQGENFLPGSWTITVTSRGLQSNAMLLSVQAIPAEIIAFNAWIDPLVELDPPNKAVWVAWNVVDAVRIVIKMNGTNIFDSPDSGGAGCGMAFQDTFSSIIDSQTTYRLEAFPVGNGAPTIREVTLEASGVRSLELQNNRPHDLVVWKIAWQDEYTDAANIPQDQNNKTDLSEGEAITLSFADNVDYLVVAINKQAAIDQGKDPEKDAIVIGNLWVYDVRLVGDSDGEEYFDIII